MINVKTDQKMKKQAQQVARDLGLPLGTVVNRLLRDFIEQQRIVFQRPEIPNAETRKAIADTRKALETGNMKGFSPVFTTAEEIDAWLERRV